MFNQLSGGKSDDQPRIGDCILANFVNLSWSQTYPNEERLQATVLKEGGPNNFLQKSLNTDTQNFSLNKTETNLKIKFIF